MVEGGLQHFGKAALLLILCAVLLCVPSRTRAAENARDDGAKLRVVYSGMLTDALEPCG
jgi:hypothetical protein